MVEVLLFDCGTHDEAVSAFAQEDELLKGERKALVSLRATYLGWVMRKKNYWRNIFFKGGFS